MHTDRQNAAPCPCSCNHCSYCTNGMGMGRIPTGRTPPHAPVPATIEVAVPVGWAWDAYRQTEHRPMPLFLQPLQLLYQWDGHGKHTDRQEDKTSFDGFRPKFDTDL
ncbi:hypothetical protein AVEN_234676-1 [Araneus ventricosus]|uniref:Uncharacterized protein n=1 Tax=Araneus ventricosus TaxID=182803 RepID=A0A4Y2GR31_ARAVE|nr:hypothetical protein AVEN_234676-1 [Araneus ventricosus]